MAITQRRFSRDFFFKTRYDIILLEIIQSECLAEQINKQFKLKYKEIYPAFKSTKRLDEKITMFEAIKRLRAERLIIVKKLPFAKNNYYLNPLIKEEIVNICNNSNKIFQKLNQ